MINAQTAKRESLLNAKALTYMSNIETVINKAVKEGRMSATTNHRIEDNYDGKQLANAIKDKLVELGYVVEFRFAQPLPSGCPSDQWQFENGCITIKWDKI